jgi:hypothetical protein
MQRENKAGRIDLVMMDKVEIDELVGSTHQGHQNRYVHYAHELPNESSELASRVLMRIVPLVYAVLLGGLADSLLLGLSVGLVLSVVFDLYMDSHSMVRALFRRRL